MNNDDIHNYIYIYTTETDMKEFMPTVNKFHKGQDSWSPSHLSHVGVCDVHHTGTKAFPAENSRWM